MKQPSILWKVIIGFIVVFIGSILVDSWILEPDRIEQACKQMQTGDSSNKVLANAKQYNLRTTVSKANVENQQMITLHGGSMNKYICKLALAGDQVTSIEFKNTRIR